MVSALESVLYSPKNIYLHIIKFIIPFLLYFSGDDHLDTARAYYGLGCALGALGSMEDALENLNRAREVQVRFIASEQDINKTEQEINRLRGRERTRAESPCLMLQQLYISNSSTV